MVLVTLIGRRFSLDGFPTPREEEVPESKPLYPEEDPTTFDSFVVTLGREIPAGSVLHGRVHFFIRYGRAPDETAVLRIKGRVSIKVSPSGRDEVYWAPDPDSTPDCPGVEDVMSRY
jgi:hypothetical protein